MRTALLAIGLGSRLLVPEVEPPWRRFAPADSSFVVVLPGEPEVSTRLVATPHGLLPLHTVSTASLERGQFLVSWTEYPEGALGRRPEDSVFARARQALLQDRPPGRIVAVEFYWEPGRFYQVMAESPDRPGAREAAERFLRSFALQHRRRL